MNSSSNIQISQSSLLSLKAEVLRKQQEVNKARILQQHQQQTQQTPLREKAKNKSSPENYEHNKGVEGRQENDQVEDEDLLRKSRRMLESKARLYNKLVKGPTDLTEEELERNKHYLVQFDRKDRDTRIESSEEDEEHFSDEYEPASNPDEEWVEYTDCLGRTRKCLRKDLQYLKEKDLELSKNLDPEKKQTNTEPQKWVIDTQGSKPPETNEEENKTVPETITENNELLSSDMRREMLRQEWEKQEQELQNKTDIHYQDVLFNEARSHGVGYYAFSKDAEERAKQQVELNKLRKETKDKQTSMLEQKALREQQLAARLKAARNRKRARMSLPPEEDEPEQPIPVEEPIETEEDKLKKATKEAEERAKENARRRQVRPWDIGKDGLGKKHYEYSQEEWVDKKRKERPNEFAPPLAFQEEKKKHNREEDEYQEQNKSLFFTTKKSKEKREAPRSFQVDTSVPPPNFKSSTSSINPYRDGLEEYNIQQKILLEPTPIIDESIDSDDELHQDIYEQRKRQLQKGTEIAPPPTYDYYGPSLTKNKKIDPSEALEDSIAAGLKFLREQAEKKERNALRRNLDGN